MATAMAMPGNTAATFLIHYFGGGLDGDDRFVVERFRAAADGDIRPVRDGTENAKRGRKRGRVVVSREEAEAMRPDRTEIIVCTGLRTRGGRQAWGSLAAGILCNRRQRG